MSLRALALLTAITISGSGCSPVMMNDAGMVEETPDASVDAGRRDAGQPDAGRLDAGFDAGEPDAGAEEDAGPGDGGCRYRLSVLPVAWLTGRPHTIELADMNADGHLDLIVATTGALEVRLNDGQGGLSNSMLAPVTAQTLAVTDVDGDGRLDVTAVDVSGVLTVLLGNGDGTLSLGNRLDAGRLFFAPLATALADLDLDGRLDFVTLDVGGSVPELRTLRGHFDGGAPRAPNGSHRLVLADVTGDGRIDALVGNAQYGLALHPGDGDGGFAAPAISLASTAVNSVGLADVNGDGLPDAVCASGYYDVSSGLTLGGGVTTLAGTGMGFAPPAPSPTGRDIIWALVLADLNRDGVLDAVTSRFGFDAGVEVLSGNDAGTFAPLTRFGTRSVWALAVGDLDEDGWLDVVIGEGAGSSGEVRVLRGSCE